MLVRSIFDVVKYHDVMCHSHFWSIQKMTGGVMCHTHGLRTKWYSIPLTNAKGMLLAEAEDISLSKLHRQITLK